MNYSYSLFRKVLCFVVFLSAVSVSLAQISSPGTPYSFTKNTNLAVAKQVMPGFDLEAIKREDKIESAMKDIPFRFGYGHDVDFGMTNSGTWETFPDGSKMWRVEISSPGAIGINLIYNKFYMPKGATFYVYSLDRSMMLGAFNSDNNIPERMFSTAPVKGEKIYLEYNQPAWVREMPELNVSSVVHEYKDLFGFMPDLTDDFGTSGPCEINVNCPLGDPWKKHSRSVSMVLLANGTRWCSGSLLNNTRNDGTPFYMTANHCLSGSTTTWIFMFRYESPNCTNIDGPTNFTITGATTLAKNAASDFALLKLSSKPPTSYNVYYAGWNRNNVPALQSTGIHHPDGDIKKISFSLVPLENGTWSGTPANSHWYIRWSQINGNTAVTEGGSSGSPIYDENKRFVGQLHGGASFCGGSDLTDLYGKFSMSWDYGTTPETRAKDWLDSANTGVMTLDGYDPFANPLSPFNLQTPVANARIVTVPGSTTPVTITWDTATSSANYKFFFGNVAAPRRVSISATTNSITTTLGALDILLAGAGFTNNGTASDSLVGQWDVWAYKNPGSPGADSLKSTNGPRGITFRRQSITISAFALNAPSSGTSITTNPLDPTPIVFNWRKSGSGGAIYRVVFKDGPTYSDPPSFTLMGNNGGYDTAASIRVSQADSLLGTLGVAAGDSVTVTWRVRAITSSDSINSTAPDRQLTLRRASLLPLLQSFSETTFPPAFWTYTFTGTQYWSRQAPGGYGASVGSAMYDYYSASAGNTQSITSNQFPPVTATNNYLRFNYAQKFYQPTSTLSADSLGIFTSTNNGANWVKLITLKATNTPQLGVNSHANLTTTGAIGNNSEYMLPANNEWATKILSMPIGTNKVMFTAWSAFGNNMFIDDISAGPVTGNGTQLSLIPDKYELAQNYPNPFNPSTKINFSVPKQGFVTLKIYDVVGKEVARLVSETKAAGSYSVDFNASTLASGVYFYRLEAVDFSETKRMMLVK